MRLGLISLVSSSAEANSSALELFAGKNVPQLLNIHSFRITAAYLKEYRPALFNSLLLSGKLMKQLHEIDETCTARFKHLLPQIQAAEGVTEALKAEDQLEWVRRMNGIHHRIEEILLAELIYS